MELAAVVDYGKPFVTATYKLKGDGPLVLTAFEVVEEVQAAARSGYTPNVEAVARSLSSGTPRRLAQLKAYSQKCIQPGLDYFDRQLTTSLKDSLTAFKAARLFSPHKVQFMQPTAASIDSLAIFPFLGQQVTLSGLKAEPLLT